MAGEITIRPAVPDEAEDAIAILDAAMLSFDRDAVREPGPETTIVLAVREDRPVGAALVEAPELVAVAVRPRHRRQGIGSNLVGACQQRRDRLELTADAELATFYADLGFAVTDSCGGDRIRATWPSDERLDE